MSLAVPIPPARTDLPIDELRARVTGAVVAPGDLDYDRITTPWNVAVPVRPALALAASTDQDVVEAVRFAARHGLRVTPQATGHGPIASLVGELLVSTAGLDECTVHPEGWARVGAGVKWLRVVEAAAAHGLAPLSGSSTDVGVVGYTTGGGLGPMARTYGLASDKVRAIEVVTGDGVLRRVTPTDDPELFFGLRGGKGMLGIITAIEFDLVRQPSFFGGALWFDGEHAEVVVEAWRTWCEQLPEQATTSFALFRLPEMPGVPPVLANRLSLAVRYVWTGDDAEGARHLQTMREVAPLLIDDVATKPFAAIDSVHADPVDPMPVHEAASPLAAFPAEAAAALLALTGPGSTCPQVMVELRQVGGAVARAPEHDDAVCARDLAYHLLLIGVPAIPGTTEHADEVRAALTPWTATRGMPNWAVRAEDYPATYDEATTARLLAAVDRYDPQGVISLGHALRG